MAASGDPKPVKEKKELTPDQKKTYGMLGLMGFLAVVVAIMYIPPMLKSSPTATLQQQQAEETGTENKAAATPSPGSTPGTEGTTPGAEATPGTGAAPEGGVAPEGGTTVAATGPVGVPLIVRHRPDPFEPFYSTVANVDPTPTPIPPVPIPAPRADVVLPRPSMNGRVPSSDANSLSVLPPIRITSLNNPSLVPQAQSPYKRIAGAGTSSNLDNTEPSYNKRLSGVIIGDGIRALLEINNGEEIVTRVVQPGDEVDGISILSIQQVTEGNRPVMRMLIRENNEERYVDLKASPQQTAQQGPNGQGQAP
jgi:hypothetical protein